MSDIAALQEALKEESLSLRLLADDEYVIGRAGVDLATVRLCAGTGPDPSVAREWAHNAREALGVFYDR